MSDFNIKDFQNEVLGELDLIRSWEKMQSYSLEDGITNSDKTRGGCLSILFFRGLDKLSNKATESYKEQKSSEKWEKEAERLLAITVIREALCSALQDVVKKEILNDERLVHTIVKTLTDDIYKKTFAIHLNSVLFGFISYMLSKTGIEKYCNQQ